MGDLLQFGWENFVRLFFLYVPFFVLNYFLSITEGASSEEKRSAAKRITLTILIVCTVIYCFGSQLLTIFSLEIDGFRIGAGILLLFTGLELALKNDIVTAPKAHNISDIIVVPMSIPTIMGPSCVSAIILLGAEQMHTEHFSLLRMLAGYAGMMLASLVMGTILFFAEKLEQIFGKRIIRIFSKLSGLILTTIASQMIIGGICAYLDKSAVGKAILEALSKQVGA